MSKKILSFVLAIVMVLSIVPMYTFAENDITTYLSYEIVDGEVTITDCDTTISGDITIPDTIEGYPVTSIGWDAFYYCTSLTSVTIPDSVTSIGNYAFEYCTSLTSVTIPDSVTSIGYSAFSDCKSLTSVTIPDSVTSIGERAFSNCTSLTSVTIPDSVTSIGNYAFYYCTSLTSVTIPDSVTSIGERAFSNCTSLASVTIPDSVTAIGDWAFRYCTSLISITVDENNANYSSDEYGVLFNKDKTELIQYPAGNSRTEYTIPDSVTSIGYSAFSDCKSLTSVTIPDSVTSIGGAAFYYCKSLTSVTIPDSVTSIGGNAFYNTAYYNDESNWENGVLYINNHLIKAKTSITGDYEIKQGTKTIGYRAFYNCTSLTSVTIPDSVTSIAEDAFYKCTSLTSITIGNSVTSISNGAFFYCTSLTSVTIPDGVTSIDDYAFKYCNSLTSVTIPDSVTSIGDYAFEYCTSLTSVTIPDSITSIGKWAFYDCTSLTSVTIPDGVTSIGDYAFYYCTSLTSITIGNSVTSIGDSAFYKCTSLTSVTIPDSVTSIGDSAFSDCTSLTSITIPDSVTSIGDDAFYNTAYYNDESNWQDGVLYLGNRIFSVKYNAKECTIKDGVTVIPEYAFRNNQLLESVIFPSSVKTIETCAFYECINLKNVEFNGPVDIGEMAFGDCFLLEEIKGFEYVEHIGRAAFVHCYSLDGKLVFENCEVEIGDYSLGYSMFDLLADIKSIAEHLAQNGHSFYEQYTCEDGECYNMYTMKEIVEPEDTSLTQEEYLDDMLGQLVDSEFSISGYRGSTAEKYANEAGITFNALGCYEHEYGEEEVLVEPTYMKKGRKGRRCKHCKHENEGAEIPCLEVEDAKENKDADNDISVFYPDGTYDEGMTVEIKKVDDSKARELLGERDKNYNVMMFDIKTMVDGENVQPGKSVLVRIPLPEGFDKDRCKIYFVDDDGNMTEHSCYHKDGYIYFETDHFSYYAVVEDAEESTDFFGMIKNFIEQIKAFFEKVMNILKNLCPVKE